MQGARTSDDLDLPKTLVRKIVKNKLLQVDASGGGSERARREVQLNKDALLAFSESAKVLHALKALMRRHVRPRSACCYTLPGRADPCTSVQVFINCLTATANDICKEQKRQTISADDVFAALQDLELGELVGPLKDALERAPSLGMHQSPFHRIVKYPCLGRSTAALLLSTNSSSTLEVLLSRRAGFRNDSKEKNKRKAEQVKKRKAEAAPAPAPAPAPAAPVQGFALPYAHAANGQAAQGQAPPAAPAPAQPPQAYGLPYGAAAPAAPQPYANAGAAPHFAGVPGGLQLTPQFVAQFAASFPAQFQVPLRPQRPVCFI